MAPTQQHDVPAVVEDGLMWNTYRQPGASGINQEVTLFEDDNCHQVMMNVRDFMSSGVKVDVVDGNELLVEGSRCVEKRGQDGSSEEEEEQDQNSSSTEGRQEEYSFRRRISFPGLARIDTMTSTMSTDGILVVTLPKKKKCERRDLQEVTMPELDLEEVTMPELDLEEVTMPEFDLEEVTMPELDLQVDSFLQGSR